MAEKVQKQLQSGTSTICLSDEKLLFLYVSTNQIKSLNFLISKKPTLLYYNQFEYPYNHGADILTIACNRKLNINEVTVQELINLDKDLNKFNYRCAFFAAVVNPNDGILEVLIRNKCDINATDENEDNALHHLIKVLRDLGVDKVNNEESFVKHVKLLLNAGIDVNKKDYGNNTAIVLAAKNKFKSIVKTLLDESKDRIELDNCTHFEKTAREWIEELDLYDLTDYENRNLNVVEKSRKDILFELIKKRNETEFLKMYANYDNPNDDDGTKTFLQYSCDKNCFEIVKFLFEKGANIENRAKNKDNEMKPLRLALHNGYHKIVEFLVEKGAEVDAESLSFSIKFYREAYRDENIDYKKCLDVLVKSKNFNNINFNEKDGYGNTPLYYSVMWGFPSITESLLKNGANLGIRNNLDFMPIQFINPEILEKHLDSCIEPEKSDNASESQKKTLKLDTLIPEQNKKTNNSLELVTSSPEQNNESVVHYSSAHDTLILEQETINSSEGEGKFSETGFNGETTIINFMANSLKLQHLLKHPVIVCFLLMKWHRIRCLFYTNITFYSIFVLSLYTYIFMKYTNIDTNSNSVPYTIVATASFIVLIVTYLLLWLRELFQFVVSPEIYLKKFENYIEICLLLITSIILFYTAATSDVKKEVSAFAIIFSAFELVLMIGQHPRFTTYVIMFKTVSANFLQLFLWCSVLLIAFALSFNVLFSKSNIHGGQTNSSSDGGQTNSSSHGGQTNSSSDGGQTNSSSHGGQTNSSSDGSQTNSSSDGSQTNSSSDGGGKEEDDVFAGLGPSLFKTLVMLTGELDASSVDFHTYPVVGRLIFTMFVFTITIILLNLVNGLAVSDTQTIKNDAELVGHIARAKLINYLETLFIGNVLEKNRFLNSYVKNLFCCYPNNTNFNGNCWPFSFFARKLCLFTKSNKNKNIFIINENGDLSLDGEKEMKCWNDCVADEETVQKATNIVAQRDNTNLVLDFVKLHLEEVLFILNNKKYN